MNKIKCIFVLICLLTGLSKAYAQANLDSLDEANAKMVSTDASFLQKASISKTDSIIWVIANMKKDHRFYGYEQPDTNSTRVILFSIFTNDVEGNPFNLKYGSSYESNSSRMQGKRLKYIGTQGNFIKTQLRQESLEQILAVLYFEKKWFEFN